MKVLIVDNNVELCQVLGEYIDRQHDLQTIGVAHDGEEALKKRFRICSPMWLYWI